MAEIASRIRQARKARGLTQAELAARSGIARVTLVQFERGASRELGIAKVLRVLRVLGLELSLAERGGAATSDYVALAAEAGSTGFKEPLSPEDLVAALVSGKVPPRKGPHFRRLLEDTPPQLIAKLVGQVSPWAKSGRVEKNLGMLAKQLDVASRDEWTKAG